MPRVRRRNAPRDLVAHLEDRVRDCSFCFLISSHGWMVGWLHFL